jgi:PadR family transcriptional regulator PadR
MVVIRHLSPLKFLLFNHFVFIYETNNILISYSYTNQINAFMKGESLGEFQELVLLAIASLASEAYGVSIQEQIRLIASRKISRGALHSALLRLEKKGYLSSHFGGSTKERGGRRKRYYQLTRTGRAAVTEAKSIREKFWDQIKLAIGTE